MSDTEQTPDTAADWRAGQVAECNGHPNPVVHGVANIHVTVRCACGAAFMSTDAGIAFGMAETHRERAEGT